MTETAKDAAEEGPIPEPADSTVQPAEDGPEAAAAPEKPKRKARDYGRIVTRGLMMIVFVIFVALAEYVLILVAVVQFAWMLLTGQPNEAIKSFGRSLAEWMAEAARFQSAVSEDKPFPWKSWPGTSL